MVDDVVRAILKLGLCATLSVVAFYVVCYLFLREYPPQEFPQYRGAEKALGLIGAAVTFFGLGFHLFRKRPS